jgi:hypothetical protein
MTENDYLKQVATLTGFQHYPLQGPWGRKSGSVVGTRDGYITIIGFNRTRQGAVVAVLLRFKKQPEPESLKSALKQNAALPKKNGKLAEVGADFLRWEWKYSFVKPKAQDVAQLAEALREVIKPIAPGFDGRCQECASASTPALTLMNGLPVFICAGCQEKVRHDLDRAGVDYEAIVPNYPNGLVLGIGAALLGGFAWGVVAYAINYIFLYGAILIGYLVAAAVLKGTGKVTRFGQLVIPVLTVASVLSGDAIFYTLIVMKHQHIPFSGQLLNAIVVHLWDIETKGSGVLSLVFALVGAGYALYSARKPKFQAAFQPLGVPNN